jgi:transcriptional regulator with XRE-family HTH domain
MTIIAESTTENRDVYPVFRGLTELGLSTADLARALGASPAAVAAWRSGEDRMPARLVAFLTLILDALVDRKGSEATIATSMFPNIALPGQIRTVRARDNLQQQQAFNCGFDRAHMESGLRLFLNWRNRKVFTDTRFVGVERGRAADIGHLGVAAT